MLKNRLRRWFGTFWLPLYLLVGVTWLLAPALAHEHYGTLRLISNEEAGARGAALFFRIGDVLAALLLLAAVLVFRIGRHSRRFGQALLLTAVLAAIDGLFPDTCYIGHAVCGVQAAGISAVHDVETIVLTALVAGLSVVDAWRHRRAASLGFVLLQLLVAGAVLVGFSSKQFVVLLQYTYETALIFWLGWLIDRYNPVLPGVGHERAARRLVGLWVVAGGMFALVTAIPQLHFTHGWHELGKAPYGLLLAQHGIVTGILMLYIARHLLRGERPALWLAAILFFTQLLKYAVLTPQSVGLGVYAVLLVLLIYARDGFDRNTQPPSWLSRLGDIGVVVGGTALAALIVLGVITLTGHRTHFLHDVQHAYARPLKAFDRREEKLSERREADIRSLSVTLAASLGAVSVWSLFRPKSLRPQAEHYCSRERFERLVRRYSVSSEDYFKIWPKDKAYFGMNGVTGAIAYRVEGGIAFMLADPIAATEEERRRLLQEFIGFTRSHGWVACVLVIGSNSPELYEQAGLQTKQIGSSAVIDVARFNSETVRSKWWRWQSNRAERSGWRYEKLLPPHAAPVMAELQTLSDAWLTEGHKTEQGFALGYFNDAYLQKCVVHVLRSDSGELIAFANELPVFGRVTQASVDLIRYLPGADGAMPVLLMHVLSGLESRYRTFDLGFVPLARLESELARLLRRIGRNRFSAAGLERFKNKFEPDWQPDYIAYDGDLVDLAKIATSLERLFKIGDTPGEEVQ